MVRGDAGAQLRPPLAYRITARQWLSIDVAVAAVAAVVLTLGAAPAALPARQRAARA
jgi:hypothetical protein